MIAGSIVWIWVQICYPRHILSKLVQYHINYYSNICRVMVTSLHDSEINLFLHHWLTDLINEDINMKAHPFLSKYSSWPSLNFKGIIFWQKSLSQNPADSLNLSKASDLAFFCWKSLIRRLIYSSIFFARFWIFAIVSHKIQQFFEDSAWYNSCITNCFCSSR